MIALFTVYGGLASAGPSIFHPNSWLDLQWFFVMIIAIFVAMSGFSKLKDNGDLALAVIASGLVPQRFTYAAVKAVPITEIVIAVLTLIHAMFTPLLAGSFLVFTVTTAILYKKKYKGDCGCFGSWFKSGASILHVSINAVITVFLTIVSIGVWFK